MQQEAENQRKIDAAKAEIRNDFKKIALDLKQHIQSQLHIFEQDIYGEVEATIAEARQEQEGAIATSNTSIQTLTKIRQDLTNLLIGLKQHT
ncbi:MAG: hypothetical protein AAGD25_22995 [Cyanobacteria bacterium P01_F01_bin.150]